MNRIALVVLVALVFIGAIVARLPLSLVTERAALPVELGRVTGTLWSGSIEGIEVNDDEVGDADVSLRFFPLLTGKAVADVALSGRGIEAAGEVSFNGTTIVAKDAAGVFDLARFGMVDAFGQTLRGTVETRIDRLVFSTAEGCREASLSVTTDAVSRSLGVYASEPFELSGEGRCDGDALVVPLSGKSADATIDAEVRVTPDGRYSSTLAVIPTDQRFGVLLERAGFARDGDAYKAVRSGTLEANL